jgi:hypothetical protein
MWSEEAEARAKGRGRRRPLEESSKSGGEHFTIFSKQRWTNWNVVFPLYLLSGFVVQLCVATSTHITVLGVND